MIERKKRENLNTFLSVLAAIVIIGAMNSVTNIIFTVVFCMLYGFCVLKIIQYGSTYDITKFEYKYTLIIIFLSGLFFGILGALIAYFLIKYKEKKSNAEQ